MLLLSVSMKADQLGRLRDILQATRLIISYVQDTTLVAFCADQQKQDAVIRRVEIIGEATAHLDEETKKALPQLSFRQMRGMRNIVAHDYGNVNPRVIWEVATIHVPLVCTVLEKFLEEHA